MSLKKYVNNAWQEITELKKNLNNAWQSCNYAKKYQNGAWTDVWNAGVTATFRRASVASNKYSYEISADGNSLSISLTADNSTENVIEFLLSCPEGFGTTRTVEYTLTQSVTNAYGHTAVIDITGENSHTKHSGTAIWYYSSCTNKTLTGTAITTNVQPNLILHFSAYTGTSTVSTISNMKINGKPVKFIK